MPKFTDGTSGSIAKLAPPASGTKKLYFDDHRLSPTGFGLKVTSKGFKVFIQRYSIDGKRRLKVIGAWPTWSLEAARLQAQTILRGLAENVDPLEVKRQRRAEPTVATLADEWLSKHAAGLVSERAIRGFILNDIVPHLGDMKVSDIRQRHFIEVIETKAETAPRSAANVLFYSRKMLNYAVKRDFIPANPLAGLEPKDIQLAGKRDPLKQVARLRILDEDEIISLWQNADGSGLHKLTALALKMILITGQRPGEVAGLHEDEINGRHWTIPAARRKKTETENVVYLTDTALEIIAAARVEIDRLSRRRDVPWNGFIFEASPSKPIGTAALAKGVSRAAQRLGNKDVPVWRHWSPHDLRRTMRTGLSACKILPHVAELVIGHQKRGIIKTYDQFEYADEIQRALELWEKRLKRIINGDANHTGGNVIAMEAKA
jgi:integrase